MMQAAFQLNANELDMDFLESVKKLFKDKKLTINIVVDEEMDETEYLLSSEVNAQRLIDAIKTIENKRETLVYKTIEELG